MTNTKSENENKKENIINIENVLNKIYENLDECVNDAFLYSASYATDGVANGVGGPFGAGIIQKIDNKYKILVIERNTVLRTKDTTCHAEINAIRKAEKILDKPFLEDCILVSTAKSCPMCLSAACWAKIPIIYYGTDYENAINSGFKDSDILEYIKGNNNNLIKEILKENNYSLEPFNKWNSLEKKELY